VNKINKPSGKNSI
jgi:hypothetical protein